MFDSLKARFILIAVLIAVSAWTLVQRGIVLGLDLQGGTHLALEVRDPNGALTDAERTDAIDRALTIIRTRIDELGVAEPTIQKTGSDRITVELPGATAQEQQRAKDVIQKAAFLEFQIVRQGNELEAVLPRIDRLVAQRFASAATDSAAPAAATPGAPGGVGGLFEEQRSDSAAPATARTDSATTQPFSSKLQATGAPGQFAVLNEDVPTMERYLASPDVQAIIPRGVELRWGVDPPAGQQQPFRPLYVLEARPLITGEYLEDAQAQRDPQLGRPIVTFQLNRRGGTIFGRGTAENIGELMAIVLDERVVSAPIINGQIQRNGQIDLGTTGTIEEARDLALVLRAGALPAPLDIVEERSVGPSLGADSIQKGQLAGIVGIALVVLIMVIYYRLAGVFAVIALGLYALYTLAMLSGVGATLTFPGIAGFVLSVAMAVDTNVLVYERTREELAAGRTVRAAVNDGFRHALPAIIDSHVTTILTSFILFQFGTGPVRGFAVTLALGLIASLFTAIYVTRTFFLAYLERRPTATTLSI